MNKPVKSCFLRGAGQFLALFLSFILVLPPNSALALRTHNGGLEEQTPTTDAIKNRLLAGQPVPTARPEPFGVTQDRLSRRAGLEGETTGPPQGLTLSRFVNEKVFIDFVDSRTRVIVTVVEIKPDGRRGRPSTRLLLQGPPQILINRNEIWQKIVGEVNARGGFNDEKGKRYLQREIRGAGPGSLVLRRYTNQGITLYDTKSGQKAEIFPVKFREGNKVRLKFPAPKEKVKVYREEIAPPPPSATPASSSFAGLEGKEIEARFIHKVLARFLENYFQQYPEVPSLTLMLSSLEGEDAVQFVRHGMLPETWGDQIAERLERIGVTESKAREWRFQVGKPIPLVIAESEEAVRETPLGFGIPIALEPIKGGLEEGGDGQKRTVPQAATGTLQQLQGLNGQVIDRLTKLGQPVTVKIEFEAREFAQGERTLPVALEAVRKEPLAYLEFEQGWPVREQPTTLTVRRFASDPDATAINQQIQATSELLARLPKAAGLEELAQKIREAMQLPAGSRATLVVATSLTPESNAAVRHFLKTSTNRDVGDRVVLKVGTTLRQEMVLGTDNPKWVGVATLQQLRQKREGSDLLKQGIPVPDNGILAEPDAKQVEALRDELRRSEDFQKAVGLPATLLNEVQFLRDTVSGLGDKKKFTLTSLPGETPYTHMHPHDLEVQGIGETTSTVARLHNQFPVVAKEAKIAGYGPETIAAWGEVLEDSSAVILIVDESEVQLLQPLLNRFKGTPIVVDPSNLAHMALVAQEATWSAGLEETRTVFQPSTREFKVLVAALLHRLGLPETVEGIIGYRGPMTGLFDPGATDPVDAILAKSVLHAVGAANFTDLVRLIQQQPLSVREEDLTAVVEMARKHDKGSDYESAKQSILRAAQRQPPRGMAAHSAPTAAGLEGKGKPGIISNMLIGKLSDPGWKGLVKSWELLSPKDAKDLIGQLVSAAPRGGLIYLGQQYWQERQASRISLREAKQLLTGEKSGDYALVVAVQGPVLMNLREMGPDDRESYNTVLAKHPVDWITDEILWRVGLSSVITPMDTGYAGLEESIPLAADVTTSKVIFITPEMASPKLFESLKIFRPAPGQQLPLVVFAEHAFHAEEIEGWMNQAGLTALEIVNVQKEIQQHIAEHPDWNLFDVVAAKQAEYYLSTGADIHTIWFFEDLKNLGRFFGVAPIHVRLWEKSLERQYGTQA